MLGYFSVVLLYISTASAVDPSLRDPICKTRNGFYSIEGSCDSYIECKDYKAHEALCPEGLHFNPATRPNEYPCGYPADVPCKAQTRLQPILGNADCPHRYGFFASPRASPANCGEYRMCIEGHPMDMLCPEGLAFNPVSGRCDWPYLVPTCDADAFLGFKCPTPPLDENGLPQDVTLNYRYESNCYSFFSCQQGQARLLSCDPGYAFDTTTGRCEDDENVACARMAI